MSSKGSPEMTMEQFTFEIDGKSYSLPRQIPFGIIRKTRGEDPIGQISILLETLADEKTLAALDALPPLEVAEKLKGWFQGATPGESSSSSD
jgi:hypothetical protein